MEAVGAGASILTFITVAFSVTHSIHSALSAIKDGPQVIHFLTDEISQLKSILQRLNEVSFVSINDIDKSQLNSLAKKCKDDLFALNSRLKSLDVANSDGRRGCLWKKLKLSFSEKDLDQVRHVVRGHVQHLTVRLNFIQVQQGSFTATQSTQILNLLRQLKQDMSALQITNTAALTAEDESPSTSTRVTEVDDEEMDYSPDTSLDDSINRLMRLLEKKPCVVESDDSEELLKDIEHVLECIRNDAEPVESERFCQNFHPDVSKELKLMANIILSSPSMMINQTATRFWRPTGEKLTISQEPKRKAFETNDGVITVTTAKRRRKASPEGENKKAQNEATRDFRAKLTYTSKSTKKMLSLSVNQAQLLFNSFSNMLPSITVCNILPENSPVSDIARSGSVQDLVRLIEGGKANIHDHDTYGWSLLHHSARNLPVLKYLIEQGLDVDEVASLPGQDGQITPSHLALTANVPASHYEALLHAGADITLHVEGHSSALACVVTDDAADSCIKLKQTLHLSPFVYADSIALGNQDLVAMVCVCCFGNVNSEPHQAHQQIRLLVEHGYDVNSTFRGQTPLHLLFTKSHSCFDYLSDYMDIVPYLIEHGADLYAKDYNGYQPWHYAYDATCEACYLFCPSAKGDLWDAVLTSLGYDIFENRKHYPRRSRYVIGYTREDFEKVWNKQKNNCPYWDDELWPPAFGQSDTVSSSWSLTRGNICKLCRYCVVYLDCFNCGVCLSSFEFFCEDDNHQHNQFCPREQVAAWELQEEEEEVYWKLVPFSNSVSDDDVSSSEDSEDGGILLQGNVETAFSGALVEEVS
ncbi:hypothetical protein F52700_9035 [Fusarium sp. NRRL 52700]|nr:hypothetical protein F52700_9035 [Fusarium sp. NRRL 52700]